MCKNPYDAKFMWHLKKSNPENKEWHPVTRRETIEGAETAINGSIDHFCKKIEATKGPKVIKTFK